MVDLRIMPVMEIIKHKTFVVVRKAAKSAKVSCRESFMVYSIVNMNKTIMNARN